MDNKLTIECVEKGKELNEIFECNSVGLTVLNAFWDFISEKQIADRKEYTESEQMELLTEFKNTFLNA